MAKRLINFVETFFRATLTFPGTGFNVADEAEGIVLAEELSFIVCALKIGDAVADADSTPFLNRKCMSHFAVQTNVRKMTRNKFGEPEESKKFGEKVEISSENV